MLALLLNFYLFLRIINLSIYVVIVRPLIVANFLSELRVWAQSGTSTVQELRVVVSAVLSCSVPPVQLAALSCRDIRGTSLQNVFKKVSFSNIYFVITYFTFFIFNQLKYHVYLVFIDSFEFDHIYPKEQYLKISKII